MRLAGDLIYLFGPWLIGIASTKGLVGSRDDLYDMEELALLGVCYRE